MTDSNSNSNLDLDRFETVDQPQQEEPLAEPEAPPADAAPERNKGGRPKKWPSSLTKSDVRRARKLGYTPDQLSKRLSSGTPLDDLVPPRSLTPASEDPSAPTFKYPKPEVSSYLAKVVIGCEMDYESAAQRLRPDLKKWDRVALSLELEQNEHVQLALSTLLKQMGIDEGSRLQFISQVWKWFYSGNEQLALQASRILAKIFFGDKPAEQAPPALKIEGFEQGVAQLTSTSSLQAPPADDDEPIPVDADYIMPHRSE